MAASSLALHEDAGSFAKHFFKAQLPLYIYERGRLSETFGSAAVRARRRWGEDRLRGSPYYARVVWFRDCLEYQAWARARVKAG